MRPTVEAPTSSSEDEVNNDGISKNGYDQEAEDEAGLSANRSSLGKKKTGSFQTMGFSSNIFKAIQRKGFRLPTPIQRKCIPTLLDGRDVVGMARTGSGKTAAFVLPLLEKLKIHSVKVGIRGLILSPSRELALQTYSVVKELAKFTDLRSVVLVGGDGLDEQFSQLATNPDIVVATPGRLVHLCVETKLSLKEVEMVVWDEADRLMEDPIMAQQMHEINARLPEARQTALFSATLPKALAEFAQAGLKNPLLVRLDTESKLSPDLKLSFFHLQSGAREAMLLLLLEKIIKGSAGGQLTVVFTATKHHVEYLQELLTAFGIACAYIYGTMDQVARQQALESFRRGKKPILIVTDLAARGIDIPLLDNVINYDFPPTPKLFVHRVGRVARAGRSGQAFSFVTSDELPFLFDLQLFLGKAILAASKAADVLQGEDCLLLGGAPQYLLDEEEEAIKGKLSLSASISSLKDVTTNACKLYKRTRPTPSPESHRRAKEFMEAHNQTFGVHPLFSTLTQGSFAQQAELVHAIQQYKPKTSHIALAALKIRSNPKVPSTPSVPTAAPSGSSITASTKPIVKTLKDEEHYLKYKREGGEDEAGYSITGSFAEQARKAVFDLASTRKRAISDDPTVRGKKNGQSNGGGDGVKFMKTEHGTRIPASYKSDSYEKWRSKTHLDIQSPGEVESQVATGRAKELLSSQAEKRNWRNHRQSNKSSRNTAGKAGGKGGKGSFRAGSKGKGSRKFSGKRGGK